MNPNQTYPFERNRYYAGKMLTSADFQAEQDYFNNKERFMNTLLYGSGVVCGLGVYSLDDQSILIESGVALDSQGREILVDASVVRKLSAIEGFSDVHTDNIAVCLKYDEEPIHFVYAATNNSDSDHEYGRMAEGYKLFVMDAEEVIKEEELETEFLTRDTLYQDEDFIIELIIPATICRGKQVKAKVLITKLSNLDKKLIFHATIQCPGLIHAGNQEFDIDLEDITLAQGDTFEAAHWLSVRQNAGEDTTLLIKSGSAYAYIDDEAIKVPSDFSVKVIFSNIIPKEIVNRGVGALSLELRNMTLQADYIVLANLKIMHTTNSYVISEVNDKSEKKYLALPGQDEIRSKYMEYFVPVMDVNQVLQNKKKTVSFAKNIVGNNVQPTDMATGTLEIPLGTNPKKGDVFFSGEIMHGLGKGNVYVEIGFEMVSTDETLGATAKSTVYGNANLFNQEYARIPNVSTGIKVLNDKGSFVVGAELLENLDFLILTYRWVAIKFPVGNDLGLVEDFEGKTIVPETPTVVLNTKGSHYFGVRFENMDSCSITYSLTEENSGEITSDGVYTAPNKEGVYEICIYCTDMPVICAYAYAIVKRDIHEKSALEKEVDAINPIKLDNNEKIEK